MPEAVMDLHADFAARLAEEPPLEGPCLGCALRAWCTAERGDETCGDLRAHFLSEAVAAAEAALGELRALAASHEHGVAEPMRRRARGVLDALADVCLTLGIEFDLYFQIGHEPSGELITR